MCAAAVFAAVVAPAWPHPASGQPLPYLVKDINTATHGSGTLGSFPFWLTDVGGVLLFSASDRPTGIDDVISAELWKTDGTEAGTVQVADIYPGVQGSEPCELTNVGGTAFFTAWTGTSGFALFKSDGNTTDYVATPAGLSWCSSWFTPVENVLFFVTDGKVWKSDGTTTVVVAELNAGNLTNVAGTLFFTGCDAAHGCELWKSNGITAELVADLRPGPDSSRPYGLLAIDGAVYFSADAPTTGREVWKSDGTTTSLFADIVPGPAGSDPYVEGHLGGTLFFNADVPATGRELWKSDGVTTSIVADIHPGPGWGNPGSITKVGDTLFFSAYEPTTGTELWKTDGTTATRVADIDPGPESSEPGELEVVGTTVYFRACDAAHGCELHRSDGITTTLVGDINPGPADSYPLALTNVRGTVFFSAIDGTHGRELWAVAASCGDGLANPGEQCDDGNLVAGDGCDASCKDENGFLATPTPAATVTPTPTATATPLCPSRPVDGCRAPVAAQKGLLRLSDYTSDARDELHWTWSKGAITPRTAFGSPVDGTGTAFAFCLYDGESNLILDAAIPAGGTCGAAKPKPCWKRTPKGYEYRNDGAAPDGIRRVTLEEGLRAGDTKIVVTGKGTRLDDPAFPIAQPVTIQLHNADGTACWGARYSAPASTTTNRRSRRFSDKAD